MTDIETLLARIDAHVAITGASPSTISRKLFGSGVRLTEIRDGGSLTLRTLMTANAEMAKLEKGRQGKAA